MFAKGEVERCTFEQNAGHDGGGLVCYDADVSVTNCEFYGNTAVNYGGGMYVAVITQVPKIVNCVFSGNRTNQYGGAIGAESVGNPPLPAVEATNCSFTGNTAVSGGGVAVTLAIPVIFKNCITWQNSVPVFRLFSGGTVDRIDCLPVATDPRFVDSNGLDDVSGTPDDDLRLQPDSPAIDAGNNGWVPSDVTVDLDGNPRNVDGNNDGQAIVDMGAYEFQPPLLLAVDIKPGGCPNNFNRDSNGVLPVALLGAADFDVTQIDLATVRISRVDEIGGELAPHEGPPGPHSTYQDVATPFIGQSCACHDLEGDGWVDLSMKFKSADLVAALELNSLEAGALVPLVVKGELLDGTEFVAYDCIRLAPPGTPPGQLNVSSSMIGAWIDVTPLDNTLEGGGFAAFQRTFALGSVIHLTAPAYHGGKAFAGWRVNGVLQRGGGLTLTTVIIDEQQSIEALFTRGGATLGTVR